MKASEILMTAAKLVCGDREETHGDKFQNFLNTAILWQAFLEIRKDPDQPLSPSDVGQMMVLAKMARTQSGALNMDDYVDQAGYAGCSGEVAVDEEPCEDPDPGEEVDSMGGVVELRK